MEDDEDKGPLYCRACRHLCENEEVTLIDHLYKKKKKKKIISVLINFDWCLNSAINNIQTALVPQ